MTHMLTKKQKLTSWALQILVALILFQTLFFKFTGAEESKYIFSTLGLEPHGRIGSGIAELIAVILLLIPATVTLGAILSVGVIIGAIFSHLTKLGIVVKDDAGLLFALAVIVLLGSLGILCIRRRQVPLVGHWFRPRVKRFNGKKKKVLILGGGFGGMYTALALEKTLARDADVEVTLVNRENFFLFTPMLHEVAASDLDLSNIVSPVRNLLKRVKFFAGDVVSIDLDAKQVTLSHGTPGRHDHAVPYDYLVIGLGSVTNLRKPEGLVGRVMTMKSLGDAIALRNRIIARLEEADTECAGALRQRLVTFVVVGGGFAGVETIGALNDFVHGALRHYPNIKREQVRMVLVHSGNTILPELGEELGRYADRKLREQGVEIRTGVRVASVDDSGVILTDATVIESQTIVWTAGTTPHPLVAMLPCQRANGRLCVNEFLELQSRENVWALGDSALVPDVRNDGTYHPPTAQHAIRQGAVVAHNLECALRGRGTKMPFDFVTIGQLASIGRRTGVARVFGLKFSGFVAWWMWRTIYLAKLPRFEKKLRVALDWTLDLFFHKDLVQFLTIPGETTIGDAELSVPAPQRKREPRTHPAVVGV
jgi:NADH dehydrogenase